MSRVLEGFDGLRCELERELHELGTGMRLHQPAVPKPTTAGAPMIVRTSTEVMSPNDCHADVLELLKKVHKPEANHLSTMPSLVTRNKDMEHG